MKNLVEEVRFGTSGLWVEAAADGVIFEPIGLGPDAALA